MPVFLASQRLKPFINKELELEPSKPILYQRESKTFSGYPAKLLFQICDVWLRAREAGELQEQQKGRAYNAELLMRGLAHVGIEALVDEATGYQYVRARDALEKILEEFITNELRKWVKTFGSVSV